MLSSTSTPVWASATADLIGNADSMAVSGQLNQLLGTHADTPIYIGTVVVNTAGTGQVLTPILPLAAQDVDEPFTLIGTTVGRVVVPIIPTGSGADLLVSLCQDNGGHPGTVVSQTRVPTSWINQACAVDGLDSAGPLAIATGNTLFYNGWQSVPWSPPATGATGGLNTAQLAQSGPYMIFAGGVDASNGNSSATVSVITWTGGSTISSSVLGPQLPQPLLSGGLAVTSDCLCYVGGVNINGVSSVVQSTVYVASWNDTTGAIGTWTAQANLPATLVFPGIGAYAATDTVYVVGGSTNYGGATATVSTVYYATIASQQLTAWTATAPLPMAIADPTVAVIGNWLIVAGGFDSSGNGSSAVYYAPIDAVTGSLGTWQTATSIPDGLYVEGNTATTNNAIVWPQAFSLSSGFPAQDALVMTWDANGPGIWNHQVSPIAVSNQDQVAAVMAIGDGTYQVFNFQPFTYITAGVVSVPMLSVPLPASGLTTNAIYHLLLQQQGGDLNDYLNVYLDVDALPGNPTVLTSTRDAYTWSAGITGTCVSIQVYGNTQTGQVWHTWEDSGARITTIIYATTPDCRLIGLYEATEITTALNTNTGFESGTVVPWTPITGSTLTISAVQAYEGVYSAHVVPNGSATTAGALSELIPCQPGQTVTVLTRVYSTTGINGSFAFSISVSWFTLTGTPISTSSNFTTIPATSWTPLSNPFTAPNTAYQCQIAVTENGTPPIGHDFYIDTVFIVIRGVAPQQSTVTQVEWSGPWPNPAWPGAGYGAWPPTGLVQLA